MPTITPSYDGLQAGDTAPATPPTCSTTATDTSDVGFYPSSCSGAVDANYTISYVDGSVEITPADLEITASDDTFVYGGTVPTITPSYDGLQAGDTAPATPPTCSTTATDTSDVGFYPSSCSGAVDANYTISYVDGSVEITPADLEITASDDTFVYGGTVPTITPSYDGLQAGDTAPATPPTCSTTATDTSDVGFYPSSCSGAVDANYTISYVDGSVEITPAAVPTKLVFAQQPSNTKVNFVIGALSSFPAVQVTDAVGNPMTATGSITLTLNLGPGALFGEVTKPIGPTGLVTFDDLFVDDVGTYTLDSDEGRVAHADQRDEQRVRHHPSDQRLARQRGHIGRGLQSRRWIRRLLRQLELRQEAGGDEPGDVPLRAGPAERDGRHDARSRPQAPQHRQAWRVHRRPERRLGRGHHHDPLAAGQPWAVA